MKYYLSFLLLYLLFFTGAFSQSAKKGWVGTWSCAPQLVEPHNMPPEPGLTNSTLRQVIRVSIGGKTLRVRFSNEFSSSPVTIRGANLAISKGESRIDTLTIKALTFNNNKEVTIKPGAIAISDPITFHLRPRTDVAITIFFGKTSPDVTGHPGSRTTSYLISGNHLSAYELTGSSKTDRWYIINGIDVKASHRAASIIIIGNSITDGRGSGTNKQNRWPDILSERLVQNPATKNVAVLNQGIGGNCVLKPCLGPSALERFDRDVLKQHGVRWLIILEGINDIGQSPDSTDAISIANNLIEAYKQMTQKAHLYGIKVYCATILPFKGSFYYTGFRETAREKVNDWIRNNSTIDAIIDFDLIMRNPEDTLSLHPELHTGDFLHPNEMGYRIMGESIDLKLFTK